VTGNLEDAVSIDGVVDRVTASQELAADLLTKAGWNALLGMSFAVVLLVSAFGFMVHAYVTYQDLIGKFALLQAIGLSMRRLLVLVTAEQVMVLVPTIVVEIIMGARVGGTIVPYLSNSGDGLRSVPPTISQINWTGVALTLGILGVVMLAVIGLVVLGVRRSKTRLYGVIADRSPNITPSSGRTLAPASHAPRTARHHRWRRRWRTPPRDRWSGQTSGPSRTASIGGPG